MRTRIKMSSDAVAGRRRAPLRAGLWILLLWIGPAAALLAESASEYQLKAVFLFNFGQFVEWPPEAFADAKSPFTICVLGDDPFGTLLDDTVRGEKMNDREVAVRRYRQADEIQDCQILFVSAAEGDRTKTILSALKGRSILTVGDSGDFDREGGMIRFVTVNDRIRLRINPGAASAGGLKLSSKLLRSAELVNEGGGPAP